MSKQLTPIDRWQSIAARTARDALLRPVRTKLAQLRIAPIVLKGDALTRVLYQTDPERRPYVDVDWLIPGGQVNTVASLLLDQGWDPVPNSPANYVQRGPVEVRVDLHSDLWFISPDEWPSFEARCEAIEGLSPLRMPSLVDHFIIVAVHAVLGHAHFRPTWVEDLERLIAAGVRVDETLERASRYGVGVPVRLAFERLSAKAGRSPRDEPKTESWFDRFREEFVRDLLCRPETPDIGHVLKWLYLPGIGARIEALVGHLVPGHQFLASRYADAPITRSRWTRPIHTVAAGIRLGKRLGSA